MPRRDQLYKWQEQMRAKDEEELQQRECSEWLFDPVKKQSGRN